MAQGSSLGQSYHEVRVGWDMPHCPHLSELQVRSTLWLDQAEGGRDTVGGVLDRIGSLRLRSIRAGGLDSNVAAATAVISYDSD